MGSFTLPAETSSASAARARVAAEAEGLVDVDVAVLLTSELVSNVVRHAETEVRVRVRRGPPFRVEVHDGVAATVAFRKMISDPPPAVDPLSIGGRGLALVHDLATRIGLDEDPDGGKVVWFELGSASSAEP